MALASTEFVVLRPIGVDTSALWSAVRQPDVSEPLQQQVAGTSGSHQRIQPRDLLDVRVRDVRRLSAAAAQTITAWVRCATRAAPNPRGCPLCATPLLPLLISGELRGAATTLR